MDFDFAIILVALTGFTGLIWLGDKLFFAKARNASTDEHAQVTADEQIVPKEPVIVEYSKSFFPVLLLVLVVRSFLVEPFQIPSQSMVPTLEVGDFILVNKYAYGLRVPVLGYKFFDINLPQRGDVMVFRNPEDNVTNYIKRVIGIPGDRISYQDNVLKINGLRVGMELIEDRPAGRFRERVFTETIDEATHRIVKFTGLDTGVERVWTVPEGEYFMMGDNRDRSRDSRFIGTVPDKNIVGKAFAIWMHWDSFFSLPTFSRAGEID